MDKQTLSNYGWLTIVTLILAVMLALASPFGNFVAGAIKATTAGFFSVNKNALDIAGIVMPDQEFADPNVTPQPPAEPEQPTEPEPVTSKAVRNEKTLKEYDYVSEALEDANEGEIIRLYKDVDDPESVLFIPNDYILDLNGKNLSASNIASFGYIMDSKDGTGSIRATSGLGFKNTKDYLPIRNMETGAYHFCKFEFEDVGVTQERVDGRLIANFRARLIFSSLNSYKLLEQDTDLTFVVGTNYFNSNGESYFTDYSALTKLGAENKDGVGDKTISVRLRAREETVAGTEIKYSLSLQMNAEGQTINGNVANSSAYTIQSLASTFMTE